MSSTDRHSEFYIALQSEPGMSPEVVEAAVHATVREMGNRGMIDLSLLAIHVVVRTIEIDGELPPASFVKMMHRGEYPGDTDSEQVNSWLQSRDYGTPEEVASDIHRADTEVEKSDVHIEAGGNTHLHSGLNIADDIRKQREELQKADMLAFRSGVDKFLNDLYRDCEDLDQLPLPLFAGEVDDTPESDEDNGLTL